MNHIFENLRTFVPGMSARIGYELERRNWSKQEIVKFSSSFPMNELMTASEIGEKCRGVVDDILDQVEDERSRRLSVHCKALKISSEADIALFTLFVEVEFTDPVGV